MDEDLKRRIVGVVTLILLALLLTWWLPTPGLHKLQDRDERRVTIDLTDPEPRPQEWTVVSQRPVAPGPAAEPEPEAPAIDATPLPEPVPATPAPAPKPVAPAEAPKPAPKPTPAPAPKPQPKPEPRPEPPKPAPKPEPAPLPKPAPAPAPAPAAGGKVQVQAGAFSHLDKAQGVIDQARGVGVSCRIAPTDTAKGTLYRVRCGPYADPAAAQAAIAKLGARGISAAIVRGS